ncbi:MAG: hypothetical protein NZ651_01135 [Candidatus Bipolaricaulota bacterium]|nr:hypothetical protein [Candidatus Bipolaricaulota bacterium]MDW8126372.1 hypothetical protein [Candidatus Bipolaricaulota bacterium]
MQSFLRVGIPMLGGEKGLVKLCRHIYLRTAGNPRATWIVVLTAALVLAVCYLALSFHERTLYLLAGFTYALGFLLREFFHRWRRK